MNSTEYTAVDLATYIDVQRFLYAEARLLDARRYGEWMELLAPQVHYCVRMAVYRELGAQASSYDVIDEDRLGLQSRVDQISNPKLTRAENPASLTRRFITNIEVFDDGHDATAVRALSAILIYRGRPNSSAGVFYAASREDVLTRAGNGWSLRRRLVLLDHASVSDGSISTLF